MSYVRASRELLELVVGLTEDQADAVCESEGIAFRVTRRDGVGLLKTNDRRQDRVTAHVAGGRVVKATVG